jgi:hypothetical protein
MEKNRNTRKGERLSFHALFKEKNFRVVVPIIQRDYAQGRENTKEVRDAFLDALYQYLEDNIPNRDLDFVYGSLSEGKDQVDFIPLDGQQRLTTLFLLHWYLYQIQEDKNSELCKDFKQALLKNNKSMFTYETRTSSSDFCDALMSNGIDFNYLLEVDKGKGVTKDNQLSKTIEDSAWFFLSWLQDPTIQSMLTMLDAIHNKFMGKNVFFGRLLSLENPIITFQFLNLKDFKLSDDLYIKMNSRGKPLTWFENFKAKFEQYLDNFKLTQERPFQLMFNGTIQDVSLNKYFSYNIDTKWANLFWNYRELVGEKDLYDEELKNFIRVIFTNQFAITVPISKDGSTDRTDDAFEFLLGTAPARKRKDYTDDISFYKYHELNALSEDGILYLIDAFDHLINGNSKIKKYLPSAYRFYFDEEKVFENALKLSFTNNQERIMFHAYVRFLIVNNGDRSGIEQWLRVIHNLLYNSIIDSAVDVARAIKSVEKMLPASKDILNYLVRNDIDAFSGWQVLEEKIKACLILKSSGREWKSVIEETEKHDFFRGQIGFILDFAKIVEYYKANNNCDWAEEDYYFNLFVEYARKGVAAFAYRNSEAYDNFGTCDFLLERATLTKGLCAVKSSQNSITSENRYNLLHTNVIGNNIARDYSWKRLLRVDGTYTTEAGFLKELFDDSRFDESDVDKSLRLFLSDRTGTWLDYFISEPSLMRYCTKGFIKVDGFNKIYLLWSLYKGANQYFAEMYTYYLWKKYIEKESFSGLITDKTYHDCKSYEGSPYICLVFHLNQIPYEIDIYWNTNENKYEITVFEQKGNYTRESDDMPDIQDLLKSSLGFHWNEENNKYGLLVEDGNKVKATIQEICTEGINH